MPLYNVYQLVNGDQLLTLASAGPKKIKHKKIKNFKISNTLNYISAKGTDKVISIYSTKKNLIEDLIQIDVIIARHKILYCIVGLSERGLMAVHGYQKYMNDNILQHLKEHFKEEYNVDVDFKAFEYSEDNFSKEYWGDGITTQRVYCSTEKTPERKLYIKLTCPKFYTLLEENPELEKYFANGSIKMVQGTIPDLVVKDKSKPSNGFIKFERNGLFHVESSNIELFNNFIKKLIDKEFFVGSK